MVNLQSNSYFWFDGQNSTLFLLQNQYCFILEALMIKILSMYVTQFNMFSHHTKILDLFSSFQLHKFKSWAHILSIPWVFFEVYISANVLFKDTWKWNIFHQYTCVQLECKLSSSFDVSCALSSITHLKLLIVKKHVINSSCEVNLRPS